MKRNWKLRGSLFLSVAFLTVSDLGSAIVWASQAANPAGSYGQTVSGPDVVIPEGTEGVTGLPDVSGSDKDSVKLPKGDAASAKSALYDRMLRSAIVWDAEIGKTAAVTDAAAAKCWKNKLAPAKLTESWIQGTPTDDKFQLSVETVEGEPVVYCNSQDNSIRYDMMNSSLTGIDYSKDYYLRAYVKTNNLRGDGFYMRAQVGDKVNQNLGNGYKMSTQLDEWTLYQIKLTDLANTAKDNSGKMKIEIFFQNLTGEVWVKDIQLVEDFGFALDKNTARMNVGEILHLAPQAGSPAVSSGDVVWTSSDETVATVSGGDVTALKGGGTKISATLPNGLGDTCLVLVDDPAMTAQYSQMRDKWTRRLTGNDYFNSGEMSEEYKTIVKGYNEAAKAALDTWVDGSDTQLFSDLDLKLKEGSGSTNSNDSAPLSTAVERILNMARAWACEGSSFYQNQDLKDQIIYSLSWVHTNIYNEKLDNTLRYGNWYHWWISMPQNLAGAAILMYDELNTPENMDLLQGINATLENFNQDPSYVYKVKGAAGKMEMTGANLADTCLVSVLRSALSQDQKGVVLAVGNFDKMVQMVSKGEGIYADGSFIQHTNLAYTGGYGATLLNGTEKIIFLTGESSWAIHPERLNVIFDWIWKGIRPLYANGAMFDMVSGRGVARPNRSDLTTGRGILGGVVLMAGSAPADVQAKIRSFAKKQLILGAEAMGAQEYYSGMNAAAMMEALSIVRDSDIPGENTLPYAWIYGGMDKAVAHSDSFSVGISYASGRTGRFEYGNDENSKGWHQSDGMLYMYNGDPRQYSDHFWNTVDSQRLMGITTDQSTWKLAAWGNYTGNANYNGGAVLDRYAAVAMNFSNYTASSNKSLTAKKAWFVFDDEVVCLGAGITGINASRDTETIVENKKVEKNNALVVDGKACSTDKNTQSTETNVSWAWLEGNTDKDAMGYFFPSGQNVFVKREERTGSYRDINNNNTGVDNTPVTRDYVSLSVKHGQYAAAATNSFKYENYDYVLLPGKTQAQVEEYSQAPDVEILSNNAYVQAVRDNKAEVSSYVFWQPSTSGSVTKALRVQDVESDYASVVMKRDTEAKTITLAIADPLQNRENVMVRLYGNELKLVSKDENIAITNTDKYGVELKADTKDTKGASFTIVFTYEDQSEETLSQYQTIRDTYADNLTGNSFTDRSDQEYLNIMAAYTKNAKEVWESLIKTDNRTRLWEDLDVTLDYIKKGTNNNDSVPFDTTTDRIRTMALAYASQGSGLYHNEQLKEDITGALEFVLANYPKELADKVYGNWWHWDIGIAQDLCDITLLLYQELSSEMIYSLYQYLDITVPFASHCWMRSARPYLYTTTAANMMDLGVVRALTGAIGNDPKGLYMASDALPILMKYVTTGDGFYKDGSYAQHGTLAYTGGYGADAIRGVAKIATLTNNTPWACTEADPNIVYEWILNSFRPLYADGGVFEMVTGRQISRYNRNDITTARYIMDAILALADSAPEQYKAQILSFAKTQTALGVKFDKDAYYGRLRFSSLIMAKKLMADSSIPLDTEVYTKIYAQMDKAVTHGSDYSLGISMYSSRKANAECGNSENFKGWYTSDGMTYLYNGDQTQYNDSYWPTVDMTRLAGITTNHVTGNLGNFSTHLSSNDWVGASSVGKKYASVGMDFAAQFSDLKGKKSWFLLGDQIVALGAGIYSAEGDFTETIVENRKINNENTLLADGSEAVINTGDEENKEISWAWLSPNKEGEAIGYYFPGKTEVTMKREDRTGKWQDINTSANLINDDTARPITRSYVSLSIEHGTSPVSGEYGYVLLPGKSREEMEAYNENNGIVILSNTDHLQAAMDTLLNVAGYNFWKAGSFTPNQGGSGYQMEAKQPVSVTVMEEKGRISVGIAEPTQKSSSVTVEIAMDHSQLTLLEKDERITVDTSQEGMISFTVNTDKAYGGSFTAVLANQGVIDGLELLKEAEELLEKEFTTEDLDTVNSMLERLNSLDTSVLDENSRIWAQELKTAFANEAAHIAAAHNAAAPFGEITSVGAGNVEEVKHLLAIYDQLNTALKAMVTDSQKAAAEAVRAMLTAYEESLNVDEKDTWKTIQDALNSLEQAADAAEGEKMEAAKRAVSNIQGIAEYTSEQLEALAQVEQKIKELTNVFVEVNSDEAEIYIRNGIFSTGMDKRGIFNVTKVPGFTAPDGYSLSGERAYDFKLMADGQTQNLLVPVLITMKIPDSVDASKDIIVLHITEDRSVYQVAAADRDGFVSFAAESFSTYVIANIASGENPGDNSDDKENGGFDNDGNNETGKDHNQTGSKKPSASAPKSPKTFDSSDAAGGETVGREVFDGLDTGYERENSSQKTAAAAVINNSGILGAHVGIVLAIIAGILAAVASLFSIYMSKREDRKLP